MGRGGEDREDVLPNLTRWVGLHGGLITSGHSPTVDGDVTPLYHEEELLGG